MLNLKLQRFVFSDLSTIGLFFANEKHLGFTLEPPKQKPGESKKVVCVSEGKYEIKSYTSPTNKCTVALLIGVPGRDMVEIHIGNYPKDTKGCPLIARSYSASTPDFVSFSKPAFDELMAMIFEAEDNEERIFLEVSSVWPTHI